MKKGDYIRTPRFCHVKIEEVFECEREAKKEGYTEPTYYCDNPKFGVYGKSLDMYHMKFAAFKK